MSLQCPRARSRAPLSLRLGLIGLSSAILLAQPSISFAEPTAQERALAETLFRDAKPLVEAGKYDEACPKLEESQRLDPKPGTMLNLAVCREKQGKIASAWSDYLEAASLAARSNQKDRESFARKRAAALEKDLPRLAIMVSEKAPGILVKLDGTALNEAAWGSATPIDPGEHTIEASAEGFIAYSAKIAITQGALKTEHTIPKLLPQQASAPEPPPTKDPLPAPPPDPPPPPPLDTSPPMKDKPVSPPSASNTRFVAGLVVGGVGVVGLGLGAAFGAKTLSARDDSGCKEISSTSVSCSPSGKSLYEDAQQFSLISTVGFAVGAAGVATAAILILTSPRTSKSASNRFLVPIVSREVQGLSAGLRF